MKETSRASGTGRWAAVSAPPPVFGGSPVSSERASRRPRRSPGAARSWPEACPIHVLLIEPHEGDAAQVRRMLMAAGSDYRLEHTRSLDKGLELLSGERFDVVLIDLDGSNGENSPLTRVRSVAPETAVIALSSEERASGIATVHSGAQDHLSKSELVTTALIRSMRYAVERQRLVSELRQRIQEAESNAQAFATIVRTAGDAIVIVDGDGCVRLVNPAAEQLFGRSAAELVGQPFGFPLAVGDTTEIDVMTRGREHAVAELRVTRSEWHGEPAYLAALRDITERRRSEERERRLIRAQGARAEAEAAERRAQFLGEASRILLSSFDYQHTLQSLARLAVPILGDCCLIDVVETHGRVDRVGVACDPEDEASFGDRLRKAQLDLSLDAGVGRVLRSHVPELLEMLDDESRAGIAGSEADALVGNGYRGALLVPLANHHAVGCMTFLYKKPQGRYRPVDVATAEDLARRALAAVENSRLFEQAQKANKAKADFLAVMSHELRTPLNAIIGYSDLLLMGVPEPIPASSQEQVEKVRLSGRHLLSLIEEILSFARMEAGRERVQAEPVSLLDLTKEAAEMAEPLASAKRIGFAVDLPQQDTMLTTDPGKVRQILLNLLSNAVKFTHEGEVRLIAERQDDWIEFRVRDTGIGIDGENVARIFEPFWQVEPSRTRRAEGTGLGLSVARRLARLLGGEVTVSSKPEDGTTFSVRLPLRIPDAPDDESGP
ncbi:MAG: ATP-binding protein [Longimicrobiales bacterium]